MLSSPAYWAVGSWAGLGIRKWSLVPHSHLRPLHRAHCTGGPMRGGGWHYAGATVQVAESSWGMATMHTQFGWGPGVGHEVPTMVGGFLLRRNLCRAHNGGSILSGSKRVGANNGGSVLRTRPIRGAREGCPLCRWPLQLERKGLGPILSGGTSEGPKLWVVPFGAPPIGEVRWRGGEIFHKWGTKRGGAGV